MTWYPLKTNPPPRWKPPPLPVIRIVDSPQKKQEKDQEKDPKPPSDFHF